MRPGPRRLLFVTEKGDVGEGLRSRFRSEGYEADAVTGCEKALELMRERHFDVVVTCIQVLDRQCAELPSRMREVDPAANIVLVTDCQALTPSDRALTRGSYDFLATSFDAEELSHVVRQGCARGRLQEENTLLKERLAADRLASVVAHEISNPLSSVVTYAKLLVRRLESHDLPADCRENLARVEAIAAEAKRCREVVSHLLAFSHRPPPVREKVDVNHIVNRVLMSMEVRLSHSDAQVSLDLSDSLPTAYLDASQLHTALTELLGNSCQALEGGGNISVATAEEDGQVVIAVTDDGPGMTQHVADQAFEPFFTTGKHDNAVGLGLPVVYGIVERHGGRVELETAPGEGCRVRLILPLGKSPEQEEIGS